MSHHKAFIVGGAGATVLLEDVIRVVHGTEVALDRAAADRVKKESPPPKSFQAEEPPAAAPSAGGACLDAHQTRAALLFKLLSLINGRSKVRLAVVEALAALLNAHLSPCLPAADADQAALLNAHLSPCLPAADADQAALAALAAALQGVGSACRGDSALAEDLPAALAAAGVEAPGLSTAERAVVQDGQSASGGTGAICVEAGKQLLAVANAVAALSAEALQADVKSLDAEAVEAQPHKNAVDAAGDIRAMLEGSRQINARRGGAGSLPAINNAAQVHGALSDALNAAAAPVKAELASVALPPAKDNQPQQASSPALATALAALSSAFLKAAALALRRTGAVVERLPAVAGSAAAAPAADGAAGSSDATAAAAQQAQQGLQALVQQAAGSVDAARQQAAVVGSKVALIDDDAAVPSLAAAQAAYTAYKALQQALSCEALAAVVSLRLQEGEPADPTAAAAAAAAPEPAADGDKADKKKKKEKKDKGATAGVALAKGTQLLRGFLEAAAAGAPAAGPGSDGELEARFLSLSLAENGSSGLQGSLAAVAAAFDPLGAQLARQLAALRGVIEANQVRRKPKIAKGARDFMPDQMAIREVAFNRITSVFKRHGAVSIDTPVFELRETLMGKYGEDSKLIYDLADQGGELLSLRYDLTVPFARYVAQNGIANIKRYHIAKVYRRDQPQMTRGRFREFFQCDFDIAGAYATMVPDAEVIKVLVEILDSLSLGEYEVKLNHRRLLDAMLDIAGVPPQKFRPICSAIDKLDKEPWEAVRAEMVEEKGLPPAVADRIGQFVVLRGKPMELLAVLSAPDHPLAQHPDSKAALDELAILFGFLEAMGGLERLTFDLSLARGLDYYTGVIYEAVLQGANVGSIAAGGRYDKLVGMFSGKEVPAVGVSIGIERVFAIMEAQMRAQAEQAGGTIRETETEVLVASIGSGMQQRRMEICSQLWAAGIKAEFGFKPNPKMADQLGYALKAGIPYMLLFGDFEIEQGVVKVKDLDAGTEEVVPLGEVSAVLAERVKSKADRRIVYAAQKAEEQKA